jgi:hypothetical protein
MELQVIEQVCVCSKAEMTKMRGECHCVTASIGGDSVGS